ncbi:MAG: hypothetical protein ABIH86_07675 [Planctomycetota bacterium]
MRIGFQPLNIPARLALSVALCLFLTPALRADIIYLIPESSSFTLEGEIIEETDEYVLLRLPDKTGKIRIPWTRIVRIERDINTSDIADDDYDSFYAAGKKAVQYQLWDKAVECLSRCAGKPGIESDAWKLLGRSLYYQEKFADAKKALETYKLEDPTDAECDRLLKDIQEKLGTATQNTNPTASDGMEKDRWVAESWSNPAKTETITIEQAGKVLSAILGAKSDGNDKVAVTLSMKNIGYAKGMNLTASESLKMQVFVAGASSINVAVALRTGPSHLWYESRQVIVTPGKWQEIEFPIHRKPGDNLFHWKSDATKWQFSSELLNPDALHSIVLLFYNRGRPETPVHVDRIYFKPKPDADAPKN